MEFGGLNKFTLIDFPGKTAALVFTIGCNFRCPYCHNPELVDETVEDKISEKEVLDFLETRKGLIEGLVITGGEPTIHGDNLLKFMKKVKDMGFLVKLDSNGTNPDFITKAIDQKIVDYIAMDMKSPTKTYYKVASVPVDGKAIKKSISLLLEDKVDYEFRTTLIKILTSRNDLSEILKEIKGAKNYYLQKFISSKILNPQFRKKTTYEDDELQDIRDEALKYVSNCEIR